MQKTVKLLSLAQGFWLGVGLIWEPGPQNIYIFTDALRHHGWIQGIAVATTASVCDTVLIVAALLGSTYLERFGARFRLLLMAVGGTYLIVLGAYNLYRPPDVGLGTGPDVGNHIVGTLLVSIPNLHAIAEIFGVIGAYALRFNRKVRIWFGTGNVCASWAWFWLLTVLGHSFGPVVARLISPRAIGYVGGSAMCFFGIVLLIGVRRATARKRANPGDHAGLHDLESAPATESLAPPKSRTA